MRAWSPIVAAVAVAVAVAAWFIENAAIHAMGYAGFAGAGWITALLLPGAAAVWAWTKVSEFIERPSRQDVAVLPGDDDTDSSQEAAGKIRRRDDW